LSDRDDKLEARLLLIALIALAALVLLAIAFLRPAAKEFVLLHLEPGVGIRQAAIISFFISLFTLIAMAIFAGDGLIGELQFMIQAFVLFYFFV